MRVQKANNRRFYAKLMLFGEYSIINHSKALTVPFKHFSGALSFIADNKYTAWDYAHASNRQIKKYADHLKKNIHNIRNLDFNIDQLLQDLENGLYFDSSIPQGYGAGSSGALIAAIYERYGSLLTSGSKKLREILGLMENFFHGQSSGIDPLVAYYQEPLLVHAEEFKVVDKPNLSPTNKEALLLLDTAQTGKTGPLVEIFIQNSKNNIIDANYLSRLNNSIIKQLLNREYKLFYDDLNVLSDWQLRNMSAMIPQQLERFWKDGLNKNLWSTKLCGSGGGGFLLVFTNNYSQAWAEMKKFHYKFIPVQIPVA